MKPFGLTFVAFLVLALTLAAQNQAPENSSKSERLDAVLKAWEERTASFESISTRVKSSEVHGLSKKTRTVVGEIAVMKPNRFRFELKDEVDTEKTDSLRVSSDGQFIYECNPREKLLLIHDTQKIKSDKVGTWMTLLHRTLMDHPPLMFLRGMEAVAAKKRFDITLTKETEWYAYLLILPKTAADKEQFTAVQLTLWMKNPNPEGQPNLTMLPCRLWYRHPNGTEVTYEFNDIQPNVRLDKDSFMIRPIQGYTVKNFPKDLDLPDK